MRLTAGQLLGLADKCHDLGRELDSAGFGEPAHWLREAAGWLKGEAGALAVRELREQSHGKAAA